MYKHRKCISKISNRGNNNKKKKRTSSTITYLKILNDLTIKKALTLKSHRF